MEEAAVLACLVAGWQLMGRVARERCLLTRLAGAVALGSLVATALTNVTMRVVPQPALPTLAAAALLCLAGRPAPRLHVPRLKPYEVLALGTFLVNAAWFVTVHLLRKPDGDYFIHMANWGLLASGHYPAVNPFLPDLPMLGHVARDVLIAWASVHAETPFPALRLLTVLWQVSAIVLLYSGVRRYGGGPLSAVAATALALYATEGGFPDFRSPALHAVIENNNPLVHAGLFLLMLLALKPPTRGNTLLTGLALGTYALVYETHFAVLVIALVFTRPAVAGLAVALAAVQGGLLTDLTFRLLGVHAPATGNEAATQSVRLHGLKPLVLTSPNHRHYALYDLRFLKAQGLGWWLLPFTLLATRGNRYGRLALLVGAGALAIPALLALGRFDAEALRMVFLAGVSFAIALGCAVGQVAPKHATPLVLALGVVAVVLTGSRTLRLHRDEFWRLGQRPGVFTLDPREQAVQQAAHPQFTAADYEALLELRRHARKGERVLANPAMVPGVSSSLDQVPKFLTTVAGLARIPVTGAGTRPDPETVDQNPFVVGQGYRGIAFWATLDPVIADDLEADWLYVLDEGLPLTHPRYTEVYRRDGRRLVRLQRQPLTPESLFLDLEIPALPRLRPSEFRRIPVTAVNRSPEPLVLGPGTVWRPLLHDARGRLVNAGDRVPTPLPQGTLAPGESVQVGAYLVAPPLPGRYRWADASLEVE